MKFAKTIFGIIIIGIAMTAGIVPAQADDSGIPDDVIHWFNTTGLAVIAMNSDSDDGNLSFPSGVTLGDVITIDQIGNQFLDSGNPSNSLLVESQSWSAPVKSDDLVVGTVTIERNSDGSFAWSASDDWWNGNMMTIMQSDDHYINDRRNPAFLLRDRSVRQATHAAIERSPHKFVSSEVFQTNAATLRDAIKQQRAEDVHASEKAGGEPVIGGDTVFLDDFVATHGESIPKSGWSTMTLIGGIIVLGIVTLAGCMLIFRRNRSA